jgi:pimeloyl-ACP methyl ester carboxylesterase
MAEHVLAMAPERFAVAGHSMGGRVALEVLRSAPPRISGLALLNTGVHTVRDGELQSRSRLLRLAYERGMSALAAEWLPPMMAGGGRTVKLMPRLIAMVERSTPESYAGQINALLNRPGSTVRIAYDRCTYLVAQRQRGYVVADFAARDHAAQDSACHAVRDPCRRPHGADRTSRRSRPGAA